MLDTFEEAITSEQTDDWRETLKLVTESFNQSGAWQLVPEKKRQKYYSSPVDI